MVKFDFDTYNDIDSTYDVEALYQQFIKEHPNVSWYQLDTDIVKIKELAHTIREKADVFVVVGIGGSFLGAKAVIDALRPYFNKPKPEIIFAGTDLSSDYLNDLLKYISNKEVYINVISKTGMTLESLVSFSVLLDFMKEKYPDYQERIMVTTSDTDGKLYALASNESLRVLPISGDIIGRYSVLTPVGLLPIAVAGIDIDALVRGAKKVKDDPKAVYDYVRVRKFMREEGRIIESFNVYEPKLDYFTEWLKQLFAESQGKNNNGTLPISTVNTRDLHSLGQYFQEGKPIIFSTTIYADSKLDIDIKAYHKSMAEINKIAMESVASAHYPHTKTNLITLDEINEVNIGYLIFFFEMAAMLGSYVLGVDYDDQPGVNRYKEILRNHIFNKD